MRTTVTSVFTRLSSPSTSVSSGFPESSFAAMASTSITRIGQVMVVTQVIGHNEDSIQLQKPPPATQTPVTLPDPTPAWTPAETDKIVPKILQGEPQCLGVRQASCFICQLTGSIIDPNRDGQTSCFALKVAPESWLYCWYDWLIISLYPYDEIYVGLECWLTGKMMLFKFWAHITVAFLNASVKKKKEVAKKWHWRCFGSRGSYSSCLKWLCSLFTERRHLGADSPSMAVLRL